MTDLAAPFSFYRPPWYPNQDPEHNPWLPDAMTGKTPYAEWVDRLPEGELKRLIEEHRERVR